MYFFSQNARFYRLFFSMSRWQRLLLSLGTIVAIVFIWYWLLFRPLNASYAYQENHISLLQKRNQTKDILQHTVKEKKQVLQKTKQQNKELLQKNTMTIFNIIDKSGCDLCSYKPQYKKQENASNKKQSRVIIQAPFEGLCQFFQLLEQPSTLIQCKALHIEKQDNLLRASMDVGFL